jgi:ribosome-binding protein aMBF1 (putative translation factor)
VLRDLVRELRSEAGLSQRGLSRALQENPTFIARIERGDRTLDVVEFLDIMRALNVEPIAGFHKLLRMLDSHAQQP